MCACSLFCLSTCLFVQAALFAAFLCLMVKLLLLTNTDVDQLPKFFSVRSGKLVIAASEYWLALFPLIIQLFIFNLTDIVCLLWSSCLIPAVTYLPHWLSFQLVQLWQLIFIIFQLKLHWLVRVIIGAVCGEVAQASPLLHSLFSLSSFSTRCPLPIVLHSNTGPHLSVSFDWLCISSIGAEAQRQQ